MNSGILLSKAKLQRINEAIFSKETKESVYINFLKIFSMLDNSEISQ